MIITTEEAKKYLRMELEYTEEDLEINSLILAAEAYLANTGAVLTTDNELAKLAVKILVVHWYENREPIGKTEKLAFSLDTIIIQLKYCSESDGGGLP